MPGVGGQFSAPGTTQMEGLMEGNQPGPLRLPGALVTVPILILSLLVEVLFWDGE